MTDATPKLDIEALKKKHKELDAKRIAAEANLKTAETRLADLKREALEKWATDDLTALKEKLEQMKQDNEAKRADYQQHIEQVEARLNEVEAEFGKVQSGTK
jgi:chromosome segregation ATPase